MTRGWAAGHRQECLCHIGPRYSQDQWSLAGQNVAQTLLSVPGGPAAAKARIGALVKKAAS
jgi:hypothetical protein